MQQLSLVATKQITPTTRFATYLVQESPDSDNHPFNDVDEKLAFRAEFNDLSHYQLDFSDEARSVIENQGFINFAVENFLKSLRLSIDEVYWLSVFQGKNGFEYRSEKWADEEFVGIAFVKRQDVFKRNKGNSTFGEKQLDEVREQFHRLLADVNLWQQGEIYRLVSCAETAQDGDFHYQEKQVMLKSEPFYNKEQAESGAKIHLGVAMDLWRSHHREVA